MKKLHLIMVILISISSFLYAQKSQKLKVFISVDMEGITGVVNWEDVNRSGKDYDYFRTIMTKEANAAVEGALDAGAEEVVVRDSHGSARNILPELLNEKSKLIRDWSGGFMSMMEGIDKSFDAVIFIGYHAKAGTENAILDHTMSSRNIIDVSINDNSLPEAGINALIAGYYDVPVVFVAGEKALCNQVKNLLGNVETVAVKEGLGQAALNLHPETAREKIRSGVEKALKDINKFKAFKMDPPFTLSIKFKDDALAFEKSFFPGAEKTGNWQLSYRSNDFLEIIKAFSWMH